jgi:superfamily II DNA or RNA helicase
MTLRHYQTETLQKIKTKLASGIRQQLVKQATGLGKTVCFSALPDHMGFTGRMLVLDHRSELTNQAVDKLKRWNPGRTVGVEMAKRRSNGEQLVVAGVQTIGRSGSPRLLQFDPFAFDALIVDEAQHAVSQSYRTVINHFLQNPKLLLLGFTATPNRADGKGLGEVFTEIVDDRDILFGIRGGWLADLRGIRIKTGLSLDGVHNKVGDFDQSELGSTVNTYARNDLIVRSWLEHAKNRQTVMFTVDVQHTKDLAEAFRRYGVAADGIWGNDPDRADKLKRHEACELQVLTNCEILVEGYDSWRVSCIGMARPTQSEGLFTQCVGRGTRIPEGIGNLIDAKKNGVFVAKDDCLLLDFVDSTKRHSLVTLPTLFGMGVGTDLRGRPISKIVAEIAQVKLKNPYLDISNVEDVNQLQSYAEQVDLFKVSFPAEIVDISKYQWHRTRVNMYVLILPHQEGLAVAKDVLDRWHILGDVNGCKVQDWRPTFEEAIREADFKLELLGGRGVKSVASREAKWHSDKPTEAQLLACKWNHIIVPAGATKGEVSLKLTAAKAARERRKAQRGIHI